MTAFQTELLVLCDQAIISREGKLSIIGIFNQIFVHRIPTHFLRMFVVAIFTGKSDYEQSLVMEIKDPGGKIVEKRKINLKLGSNGRSNFLATIQGLHLHAIGTYTLSFKKSNRNLAKKSFQVVKVRPNNKSSLPN